MQLDEKTLLFLTRRKKGILLKQVAEYAECSIPLLSLFENEKANVSANVFQKYKEFIENY